MQIPRKDKKDYSKKDDLSHLDMDTATVVSSNDMTGLIQRAPKSDSDQEDYEELYDYNATTITEKES